MIDRPLHWFDKLSTGTEDVELIVFCGSDHAPWRVLVPIKITDTIGEATVHEKPGAISIDNLKCNGR